VIQKYPFTKQIEALLTLAITSSTKFYEIIGHALEPDRMPSESAKYLVLAAKAVAKDAGSCSSPTLAIQHLRLMVNQGKLTLEDVQAASDLIDTAEDIGGVEDLDGLISTVKPAVQKIMQQVAVESTIQGFGQGESPEETAARFEKIAQVGTAKINRGSKLELTVEAILKAATSTIRDPLHTGIDELDFILGGIERATLALLLGGTGDGKSLVLCHIAAEAMFNGYDVAHVTLELDEMAIQQRIFSNLTGMTPAEQRQWPSKALDRLQDLSARPGKPLGGFRVAYFTPLATTVRTLKDWVNNLEKEEKFKPDLIVVDYMDKMVSSINSRDPIHIQQRDVVERLRSWTIERDGYLWTASQTTGRNSRKKQGGLEDTAESMAKPRTADTVVQIVRTDEDVEMNLTRFRIPKRRNGQAHQEAGPFPMDAERWRACVTNRNEPWK